MILLLDHLDSFTYNLYQYVEELGFRCQVKRAGEIGLSEIKKLNPRGIILSPGPGHPRNAELAQEILMTISKRVPTLGVCLGHQAIGLAFGGSIKKVKRPLHGKISWITTDQSGVFKGLPERFRATRYHSLYVDQMTLPASLQATGWSEEKGGEKILMGIRHKSFPIEGVQFHPESICTEHGKKMILNFLRKTR